MSIGHEDVYAVTARGTSQLKGGATTLSARELELLVLVDGRRPVAAIARLAGTGDRGAGNASQVAEALRSLLLGGFIRIAKPAEASALDYFFAAEQVATEPSEQAMESAAQEAASGAVALREQGYYVSIARRARVQAQAKSSRLTVLVVEDEPLVAKYLKALVQMEGHVARMAGNREEIAAQLGAAPLPDLVILDVMLPDANGFEVLQRMKSLPSIAEVPVMIVTTQATRESVMKGLAFGADGYFTKPFEVDVLLRGMKAVLGLLPTGRDDLATAPPWLEKESRGSKG